MTLNRYRDKVRLELMLSLQPLETYLWNYSSNQIFWQLILLYKTSTSKLDITKLITNDRILQMVQEN